MKTNVYSFDPKKNKRIVAGMYDSDANVYSKGVNKGIHFMKIVDGYGIQEDIYESVVKRQSKVQIFEISAAGRKVLTSSYLDWNTQGKTADYGHGKQRFLSVKYMQES